MDNQGPTNLCSSYILIMHLEMVLLLIRIWELMILMGMKGASEIFLAMGKYLSVFIRLGITSPD
jgi:hypothetical protein